MAIFEYSAVARKNSIFICITQTGNSSDIVKCEFFQKRYHSGIPLWNENHKKWHYDMWKRVNIHTCYAFTVFHP